MTWILTKDEDGVKCAVNTDRYDDAYVSKGDEGMLILSRRGDAEEENEQFIRESLDSFQAKVHDWPMRRSERAKPKAKDGA